MMNSIVRYVYKHETEEHFSGWCSIFLVLHLCKTDYASTGRNNELNLKLKDELDNLYDCGF